MYRHRTGVVLISIARRINDEFFLTVSGFSFDMCMIPLNIKPHFTNGQLTFCTYVSNFRESFCYYKLQAKIQDFKKKIKVSIICKSIIL